MYMAYTINSHLPKVRAQAVWKVKEGWSVRKTARYFGVWPSTISRWIKRFPEMGCYSIPTLSSRPHSHPKQLSEETVRAILDYRRKYRRCAQVIHYLLLKDGLKVSLASVKRVLKKNHCSRFSKWKRWHKYPERPIPDKPGILVQIDTIFDGIPEERLYVYTLIDVCSRWGYALPTDRISTHKSLFFVKESQRISPFRFETLQSDHGPEFSKWFTKQIISQGWSHRHSRIRTPSDNGHLERFNRTLQEECLLRIPRTLKSWRKEIPEYLSWYNTQRPHMALSMRTPLEVLRSY